MEQNLSKNSVLNKWCLIELKFNCCMYWIIFHITFQFVSTKIIYIYNRKSIFKASCHGQWCGLEENVKNIFKTI